MERKKERKMERKKERKKERKTNEANEKMSCLRWDLNPRHSALRTDALTN